MQKKPTKVIRISTEVFEELGKHALHFREPINEVLKRILKIKPKKSK